MSKEMLSENYLKQYGLTPLQEKSVSLLMSGKNICQVASECGLPEETILQWQGLVSVQCYKNRLMQRARGQMEFRLASMYEDALKALQDCLNSENDSIRLKAASAVVEMINALKIGGTDVRKEIRQKCSPEDNIWIDEDKYQRMLKENGVD